VFFTDRNDAGRRLADQLERFRDADPIVLALPRGGIPVGYEVARHLGAPLEVFLVRKLGTPGREELAMGAIASGGAIVLNEDVIDLLGITGDEIEKAAVAQAAELKRREARYRQGRPLPSVSGRTVLVVDDGLATGSTMRACVRALRQLHPERIVVAAPVGAAHTCNELREEADEVVCLMSPEPFYAIGQFYEDFAQLSDEEVESILMNARRLQPGASP
jgi:predicted phosphoribosyltransferase